MTFPCLFCKRQLDTDIPNYAFGICLDCWNSPEEPQLMDRYALPGSDRHEIQPHGVIFPRCHPQERAEVTIRLTTGSEFAIRRVVDWALTRRLGPTFASVDQKLLKVTGSIEDLENAFGVELHQRETAGGQHYRAHYGPVTVPSQIGELISGVFGLDTREVAKPRLKKSLWESVTPEDPIYAVHWYHPKQPTAYKKPPGTFTPLELAELYSFPAGDGHGETIALIELGGGYRTSDLTAYWQYLGINGPNVVSVGVNGARNQPGSDADGEVLLDIEVAGAIAPKSTIAVYFGGNTDRDFLDCISTAIHDEHYKPSVISISWGSPESNWTQATMTAMDQLFQDAIAAGITVLVASGDNGSSDGVSDGRNHADFPASSPHVCGTGGTKLVADGSTIVSEVVWNEQVIGDGAGGGGCSSVFPVPSYQSSTSVCESKRGVPDVAGCADPSTGYVVRIDSQFTVIGGTSSAAPLYAGLVARINQITGKRVGALNPIVYAHPHVCRDVTQGNNGAYNASGSWDACTGLGSIDGASLLAVLKP